MLYKVLDLFSGCGGLSLGFEQAGYDIVGGIDVWKDAIDTFKYNHPNSKGIVEDLESVDPQVFSEEYGVGNIDVIVGGPPCQGFSIAGKRVIEDERNKLYRSFIRMVKFFSPKVFLMENVPNIITMGGGLIKDEIIKNFQEIGYETKYKVLVASDYGVPQKRKRAFFIGFKKRK